MNHDDQSVNRNLERIVLYLIIAGFLVFIGFRTVRLVNARVAKQTQNVAYYQISPLPTFTFTPSPVAPTNTPHPPVNTPVGQTCTTYSSTDTPIALPNGTASINSTINVASNVTIADVNVTVGMPHHWVGDLSFTLSKGLSSATIIDRPGAPASTYGCSGNDIQTTLDDEAALPVENQCANSVPTINGIFAPNNPLSVFDGQGSSGNWTLTVDDSFTGADGGTLNSWSVEICSGEVAPPPTPTDTATPTVLPPTPTDTPVPYSPLNIDQITGPTEPIAVDEEAVIVVSFSDPDSRDSHSAIIEWGDGTTTTPPIDIGDLVTTDTHVYAGSGIYSVVVTITNSAGASDSDTFEYISVYDPDGGFVTGGGWIDSPAGAYKDDPELTGKANFGFGAKYKKGKGTPQGNTVFKFQAGDLTFKSDSYQWLILNPDTAVAIYQSKGSINGNAAPNGKPYKFLIWAADGSPDKLRINIWYEEPGGNVIVYDNGFFQPLGGGNIIVHGAKTKP